MKKQRLIFVGLVLALLSMAIFIYQRYRVAPSLLLPEIQLSDLYKNQLILHLVNQPYSFSLELGAATAAKNYPYLPNLKQI